MMTDERRVWGDDRGREHPLCEALTKSKRRCKARRRQRPVLRHPRPFRARAPQLKIDAARAYADELKRQRDA